MKEVKNDFIKKFEYGDYLVYIKDCVSHYESYIQHKEYGIMQLMWGIDKATSNISIEEYIKIVNFNLEDYILKRESPVSINEIKQVLLQIKYYYACHFTTYGIVICG